MESFDFVHWLYTSPSKYFAYSSDVWHIGGTWYSQLPIVQVFLGQKAISKKPIFSELKIRLILEWLSNNTYSLYRVTRVTSSQAKQT